MTGYPERTWRDTIWAGLKLGFGSGTDLCISAVGQVVKSMATRFYLKKNSALPKEGFLLKFEWGNSVLRKFGI
jgi:hypothetical protein